LRELRGKGLRRPSQRESAAVLMAPNSDQSYKDNENLTPERIGGEGKKDLRGHIINELGRSGGITFGLMYRSKETTAKKGITGEEKNTLWKFGKTRRELVFRVS